MDISLRRHVRFAASLAVAVAAVLAAPQAASADVEDFSFERLEVDYTLTRAGDGTSRMRVVEEFVAVFPETDQNRGIRRVIPDEYDGQPLRPSFESAVDADGAAWEVVETDDGDDGLVVTARSEDYVHGRQTFVFTYTLDNVTREFPDTGIELYWDVNGFDSQQRFGEITARLHLDGDVADAVGATACYAGAFDAETRCDGVDLTKTGTGVTVTARQADVGPHESLTVAVGFADGTFEPVDTSYLATPLGWGHAAVGAGLVGSLGWALWLRRRRLADGPGRPTIIAESEPPPGVDALQAAVLLEKTGKAIPAEVLEQAVVGSIRITEGEKPRWGSAKLVAELIDPGRADENGRVLLNGLFPNGEPGDRFEFGSSDTRLSTTAQKILKDAAAGLKERGLRREVAARVRVAPILVVVALLAALIVLTIVLAERAVQPLWPIALLVVGIVAVLAVVGLVIRTPLTAEGAEIRDHLAGLRRFIEWAEADRIRMLQAPGTAERVPLDTDDPRAMLDLYERLLPYAVVFGQERQWARHLAVLYASAGVVAPVWYAGTGGFDAASFSSGIGSLSATTSSSSSTGGSSGGGSAGGGGGGGGVGGV
ncbi:MULTISPECIES: DUF2207 domain-containing protein [unclassified Microbacterium]|uniref:DUF2207 family protein n=1 Tax=unclassified Microbacterium TaxID=2609290 RepID=UPI002002AC65|nr:MULTISPECIES: DUF2207 domain-containing protein [unclassified Microbacterium]